MMSDGEENIKKATGYLKIVLFSISRSCFYALSVVYTKSPFLLLKNKTAKVTYA